MSPDSLVLQVILEKQQELIALRDENRQLREYIEQQATASPDPSASEAEDAPKTAKAKRSN